MSVAASQAAAAPCDHRIGGGPVDGAGCVFAFDAIGTRWQIDTEDPLSEDLGERVLHRIEEFDSVYSRFRPDSQVSRAATAPRGGRFDFPEDSTGLFDLYDRLFAATDGAVDPLVGRDLELLGYDAAYSLTPAPASRPTPRTPPPAGCRTASRTPFPASWWDGTSRR